MVGTDTDAIGSDAELLAHEPSEYRRMAQAISPNGDGRAAKRSEL